MSGADKATVAFFGLLAAANAAQAGRAIVENNAGYSAFYTLMALLWVGVAVALVAARGRR